MSRASRCILGAGEVLWDKLPDAEVIGGAPFNVVSNLARLGHQVGYLTAVGADDHGSAAIGEMRARGIDTALVGMVHGVPTGLAQVQLGRDRSPDFKILRPAAYEHLRVSPGVLEWVAARQPWAIVFGTLAFLDPETRAALRSVVDAIPSAVRLYDVNLRAGLWSPAVVTELLAMANVVKFSEAEAQELAPVLGLHWKGPKDFTQELAGSARLRGVAVTAGAAASSLLLEAQYSSQKPPETAIVDTVGAGDAFAAGLLDAIAEGLPAAAALRHANALGALVASGQGAQPPWSPGEVTRLEEGLVLGAGVSWEHEPGSARGCKEQATGLAGRGGRVQRALESDERRGRAVVFNQRDRNTAEFELCHSEIPAASKVPCGRATLRAVISGARLATS